MARSWTGAICALTLLAMIDPSHLGAVTDHAHARHGVDTRARAAAIAAVA